MKNLDLTRGNPVKLILLFTLPILIGNVFQQLYNTVDTVIVGRTLGNDALAGVGATGAVSFLINGFVWGLTGGFAVITSQTFGAKNEDEMRKSVAISFLLCLIMTVILTVVSVIGISPLLKLMRTPADILVYAEDYILVICWGMGATVLYNMASNIVRALGDSVMPLVFLIVASVINVGLDFLLIVSFDMGVMGAAVATVISQALAGIGCVVYLFARFKILRLQKQDFRFSSARAWRHLAVGLPMAFQFSITAIGVLVQQAALNTLGKIPVTAYSAANKIDNLAVQPMLSLGTALATYCGQNYGAMRFDRIEKGAKAGALLGLGCAVFGLAFVWLFGTPMTRLFLREADAQIVALSKYFLMYQGAFYVFLAAIFVYRNILQGMNKSLIAMIAGVIELAMRILASFVLVKAFQFTGLSLSNPVAWVGAGVFLLIAYYVIIKRIKRNRKPKDLIVKGAPGSEEFAHEEA